MTATWTIVAGAIPAGLLIATQMREELLNSSVRNSRFRARFLRIIGRPRTEADPGALTPEPHVQDQVQGEAMLDTLTHYLPQPYYGPVLIMPPAAKDYDLTNGRGRALLAADAKDGTVDFRTWPVSRLAMAFGVSKRSLFEALRLGPRERAAVRNRERPLYRRRPTSSMSAADHLAAAIDGLGVVGVQAMLSKVEATRRAA